MVAMAEAMDAVAPEYRGDGRLQRRGLDNNPQVERVYTPDREAMRAALRVVLGLPKRPSFGQEVPA